MKDDIKQAVTNLTTFEEIGDAMLALLQKMKADGYDQIGYVAGIISSDGHEKIPINRAVLARRAQVLRHRHGFPLFCAPDVLSDEVIGQLLAAGATADDFIRFWRKILRSGLVTDIFMTPRWQQSVGASDEHKTALEQTIKIHYS